MIQSHTAPAASRSAARACRFPSAHDRHRRQVRRDHQQQQRNDAGDREVAARAAGLDQTRNLWLHTAPVAGASGRLAAARDPGRSRRSAPRA